LKAEFSVVDKSHFKDKQGRYALARSLRAAKRAQIARESRSRWIESLRHDKKKFLNRINYLKVRKDEISNRIEVYDNRHSLLLKAKNSDIRLVALPNDLVNVSREDIQEEMNVDQTESCANEVKYPDNLTPFQIIKLQKKTYVSLLMLESVKDAELKEMQCIDNHLKDENSNFEEFEKHLHALRKRYNTDNLAKDVFMQLQSMKGKLYCPDWAPFVSQFAR
jgi:hypothetical protein